MELGYGASFYCLLSEVVCLKRNIESGEALPVSGGWILSFGVRVICTLGLHDAEWGGVDTWFDLVHGSISMGGHSIPLSKRLYCWQCFTYLGFVDMRFWGFGLIFWEE